MISKLETGKRIAYLRGKLGYSQAAFAEKLNVSPQAVSKWETGQTLPDVEILLTLSWMCRITVNEILDADEVFVDRYNSMERELVRMNKYLICPECKKDLSLKVEANSSQYYECKNHHRFNIEDGVVYFNTREIPGELWSLNLRNYEHYLMEATYPGLPRYMEGEVPCKEIMWQEIEKLRPATIVDIACGTGSGIQYILKRINWPCTVILADLSFRILAWNRKYFTEEIQNPYVDYVFLACDCSNISDNTKKWMELYLSIMPDSPTNKAKLKDLSQWLAECKKAGFSQNKPAKVYCEMPAPDTDVFPFENQVMRWMACYAFVSSK